MGKHNSHEHPEVASSAGRQPNQENSPNEVYRLLNRGADLLQQGRPTQALPHLERARELDATNVVVAINLGGAYIMLGRHREAIPLLEAAATLETNNAMIWMNLGAAYLGNPVLSTMEQQERAIAAFRRALALEPTLPNVNYNMGLIFRDQGKWGEAREEFQRALEAKPDDRDARLLLDKMTDLMSKTQRDG